MAVMSLNVSGYDLARCLVVSLLFALAIPVFSVIIVVPEEGEEVIDLEAIDSESLRELSGEELEAYLDAVPTRRLTGLDRLTYQFTHPQYFYFFIRAVAVCFAWVLAATVVVTYMHGRSRSQ
jgi:hypothetical protein